MHHVRDSVHRGFERNRYLLLDLFRRDSRPLGDDLNVVVRHIRIGFDGKPVERNDAPARRAKPQRPAPAGGCSRQSQQQRGSSAFPLEFLGLRSFCFGYRNWKTPNPNNPFCSQVVILSKSSCAEGGFVSRKLWETSGLLVRIQRVKLSPLFSAWEYGFTADPRPRELAHLHARAGNGSDFVLFKLYSSFPGSQPSF